MKVSTLLSKASILEPARRASLQPLPRPKITFPHFSRPRLTPSITSTIRSFQA